MSSLRIFLIGVLALTLGATIAAADPSPDKLLADGRVDEAVASLRSKIQNAPTDASSHNLLCRAYLAVGNWDAGISACEKAVTLEPSNSQYHLWLGRIYGEKADHVAFFSAAGLAKKVRNEFETAVRLDPRNQEARADLAEFYLEAPGIVGGGKDKAEGQAQELSALDPPQGNLVRARIAEKNSDWDTAEKEFHAAIQISGGRAGTWMNLAQYYRRRGRLDDMQDAILHAASAPKNQHVLMSAAEALIRTKRDLPLAAELLRRYLASNTVEDAPTFKAHYWLGVVLQEQGDKRGAAQEYRAALALARNYAQAKTALNRLNREVADGQTPGSNLTD